MTIAEWEQKVKKLYDFKKTQNLQELKPYLSHPNNYATNFNVEGITEGDILDEFFYAAYIFSEKQILGKSPSQKNNSGWRTTIVFTSSINGKDMDDFYAVGLNGFSDLEVKTFFKSISL